VSERRVVPIALPSTGADEWNAVRAPIFNGWLTQGPEVAAFERAFAERHAVKAAVATTSCTTALHLVLAAMGIGPGDEVIVPAFTWIATANAVLYCGARPVFVDVEPSTFNIDASLLHERLSERTRAIVAVHLFGLCADVEALRSAARGTPIVEDAACAAGASYAGRAAGGLGLAAAFSFHPRKSVTTGEGGMVTTNDAALAEAVVRLRNHGAGVSEEARHRGARPYLLPDFDVLGFNYRMTDLQAAVGRVQLGKLDRFIAERGRWAQLYADGLADLPWLRTPVEPAGYGHAWQSYVCQLDAETAPLSRDRIMEALHQDGVATRPGTHAVHMLGLYRERIGARPEDFPRARAAAENSLALPLHNRLERADVDYVIERLHALS
jgi:perosamine synthetase